MDGSARTLTASFVLITAAVLIARSFTTAAAQETGTDKNPKDQNRHKRNKNKSNKNQCADEPRYVAGLVNVGNTCFMNAVLQTPNFQTTYKNGENCQGQSSTRVDQSATGKEREKVDHTTTLSLSEILDPLLWPPSSPSSNKSVGKTRQPSISAVRASSLSLPVTSSSTTRNNQLPQQPSSSSTSPTTAETKESISRDSYTTADYQEIDNATIMTSSMMLDSNEQEKYKRARSPFMGLLASRVSCVDCGYTAAIRHTTFDSLSLTVPLQYSCSLEQCLDSFIHLDTINDFNCRKCTLIGASNDLGRKIDQGKKIRREREEKEKERLQLHSSKTTCTLSTDLQGSNDQDIKTSIKQPPTSSASDRTKRRRSSKQLKSGADSFVEDKEKNSKNSVISLSEMEQLKAKIDYCLTNDIERDLEYVTKRITFRNNVSQTTKTVESACDNSNEKGDKDEDDEERVIYRLWSVIVHLGSHNSGHFVTYRRISYSVDGQPTRRTSDDDKWWRISDEDVQVVEWALVKNVEAYMLFYEKE
ncbi:hypothetical protein FBU30_000359 [Linnemannia zychae]|nr:hypothetical protein FBU30_000359 [Linnemannia zychae]